MLRTEAGFPAWFNTRPFGLAKTGWHARTRSAVVCPPVRSDAVRRFLLCPYGHTTNGVPLGFPHARSGRVGEIYRCGPIAERQEKIVFRWRADALHARECVGSFGGSAAGCAAARRFEDVYPCQASGRSICPAASGEKRKISLAHPPQVCPDRCRREDHGPATRRSVEQRGRGPEARDARAEPAPDLIGGCPRHDADKMSATRMPHYATIPSFRDSFSAAGAPDADKMSATRMPQYSSIPSFQDSFPAAGAPDADRMSATRGPQYSSIPSFQYPPAGSDVPAAEPSCKSQLVPRSRKAGFLAAPGLRRTWHRMVTKRHRQRSLLRRSRHRRWDCRTGRDACRSRPEPCRRQSAGRRSSTSGRRDC
jgi:hypothetical protein